eukprot:5439763-Prorocentrum_lima.AAC.1
MEAFTEERLPTKVVLRRPNWRNRLYPRTHAQPCRCPCQKAVGCKTKLTMQACTEEELPAKVVPTADNLAKTAVA